MPSISGKFDKQKGIIIQIGVAAAGSFGHSTNGRKPVAIQQIPALVDTGATNTCLSPAVINELGISAVGKIPIQGVGGVHPTNIYRVDLMLIYGPQQMVRPNIQITEFKAGIHSPFQALLGLDVLGDGVLTMSFDGHFSLSH